MRETTVLRFALRLPLVLLAAMLFAPALVAAQTCSALALTGAPSSLIFADGFESGTTDAWGAPATPSFSILETVDLGIEVTLSGLAPGDHLLELRFRMPGGFLYESRSMPVSTLSLGAEAARLLVDYPFPVAVKSPGAGARMVAGSLVVDDALPIAGSSIVAAGVNGIWEVQAILDGGDLPCASEIFRLDP